MVMVSPSLCALRVPTLHGPSFADLFFPSRNMFLAASPYFQTRFSSSPWILENFQSAITSTFTFTTMFGMIVFTNIQASADYPFRITSGLAGTTLVFALLALSTKYFLSISTTAYFVTVLLFASASAWSTGLMQNGAFAFAGSFGRPEYVQAVMAGQGVAGVLPAMAQIASVLFFDPAPTGPDDESPPGNAAGVYFLTAVLVSLAALGSFIPLWTRHNRLIERRMAAQMAESITSIEEAERAARRYVSLPQLFRKLPYVSGAVFMCMAIDMFFPVFTSKIVSVRPDLPSTPPIFSPGAFIGLGFFFWNLGDLLGRLASALPFSLRHKPVWLFGLSVARVVFLPMYLLCNIRGLGAAVNSDFFYLVVVQFPFGLTNGWLCSSAMMASGEHVDEAWREAAGGFMGLMLVTGLTVGSLASFSVAGI